MEHLDATLVFLDPTIKPMDIRSRRVPHWPPALPDLARTVLDLMRRANEPLTTHEMALRLIARAPAWTGPICKGQASAGHEPGRRAAGGACEPAQATDTVADREITAAASRFLGYIEVVAGYGKQL